jgi:hypothetical protein
MGDSDLSSSPQSATLRAANRQSSSLNDHRRQSETERINEILEVSVLSSCSTSALLPRIGRPGIDNALNE